MADVYYELENVVEIGKADELTIPRAGALLGAVRRDRDCSLIRMLRHVKDGAPTTECLIVDVECDGVPPKNPVGIGYRERLALCVPSDPTKLIDVLALRQDFPILMHQNQGAPGEPASLCLYFESTPAVMRTWTPAAFLRRIRWWLEKSSRGDLHPADQPVEHLFFASKYELVLPWNLAELRNDPACRFVVRLRQERPDQGFTCFLEPMYNGTTQGESVTHVELMLPPVVHGLVESDPGTLGQLADLLERHDVDLITPLRATLQARVGEDGAVASDNDKGTVILLQVPIRRDADAEPVGVTRRAFLVQAHALELGVAAGALLVHENRYYKDLMNVKPSTEWRERAVLAMDVLTRNDAAAARRQSGIVEQGPEGVLIGAGSLGGALLNIWGRGGWGDWTVIDKDHIKPHNLSRHLAYEQHIGETKATVVAQLHAAATGGATEIVPVVADVADVTQEAVAGALGAASLVVDASTTLEYPRAASAVDAFPRHCSVFITPDGNGAVLLVEDARRAQRLRTLETQYYRALIGRDWGKTHLSGHARTFWSGASCRDISAVMPYARILGQASTLAEQIQAAAECENALIRVWQRDPVRGTVEVHDVEVLPERRMSLGDLDLFIDDGVEQHLREMRRQGFPNETGGVLLGYHDFNIKAVSIVAGLPAPPDSKASRDSFERGVAGLADAVKDAWERTAGMVNYIGEWHSHPPGHSASHSRRDLVQLIDLAVGMADDGLPAVQLIVGEHDIELLHGEVK